MMMPFDSACSAAAAVDLERQRLQPRDEIGADQPTGFLLADVDVVSGVGLRRRREDRLGQPIGFAQAGRQLTPQTLPVCWYSFQPDPDR